MKKIIQKNQIKKNNKDNYYSLENLSKNYSGIFPNSLFTQEENSIFKNYNFIPDKNIINFDNKYKKIIDNINFLSEKIKKENKINDGKKLELKFKIEYITKKSNNLEMKNRQYAHLIKINNYKILKIKDLIKKKQSEENDLNLALKSKDLINNKLKEIIDVSFDIKERGENNFQIQNIFKRLINIFENIEDDNSKKNLDNREEIKKIEELKINLLNNENLKNENTKKIY